MSSPSRSLFPRPRRISSASEYGTRFNGSEGRFGSAWRSASSALHSERTCSIAESTATWRNGKKSSGRSIQDTSPSKEVNSVACRTVSDGSARNAGAISYTRSRPVDMSICLYSCGLWLRNARRPKYVVSNNVAPPSAPAPASFGVWTSMNPWLSSEERNAAATADRIRKIARRSGFRRSSARLSNRVSMSAPTLSAMGRGNGAAAGLRTSRDDATSSHPFRTCGFGSIRPRTATLSEDADLLFRSRGDHLHVRVREFGPRLVRELLEHSLHEPGAVSALSEHGAEVDEREVHG